MDTEYALLLGTGTPPLGWDAVRAFEAEHAIVLPEPYRTFVAEICDGSLAGPPHYGLLPLAAMPADWGHGRRERLLAEPFPLTEPWPWEDDEGEESVEEFEARLAPVFDHGSIVLGTDGCGMNWHLVVTGADRGRVWLITGEGALPFAGGFAEWVGHWAAGRDWFDTE
ncbi:SMI1/KNR4 family protein [Streptomyces sp. NBC_01351]|uniref:SMI1/KNR4 family protein n=1 Tax=Streptomyces sp. NBC_01351 TaxID=2903833 RepID=UPI002E2EF24C|nr:SMI1/KNR4 family protein [Streptomyces sp. NBC_01351]